MSRLSARLSATATRGVRVADTMTVMLRWQRLQTEGGPQSVLRAKVPGGWLIWCDDSTSSGWGYSGVTFVPDAAHEWDGRSL